MEWYPTGVLCWDRYCLQLLLMTDQNVSKAVAKYLLMIAKYMSWLAIVLRTISKTSRLQEWSDMWNLYFNVAKCKVMQKGRKNKEADYKMKVKEDENRSIAKCNEERMKTS